MPWNGADPEITPDPIHTVFRKYRAFFFYERIWVAFITMVHFEYIFCSFRSCYELLSFIHCTCLHCDIEYFLSIKKGIFYNWFIIIGKSTMSCFEQFLYRNGENRTISLKIFPMNKYCLFQWLALHHHRWNKSPTRLISLSEEIMIHRFKTVNFLQWLFSIAFIGWRFLKQLQKTMPIFKTFINVEKLNRTCF